jgi:hypothetical protein
MVPSAVTPQGLVENAEEPFLGSLVALEWEKTKLVGGEERVQMTN